MKPSLLAVAISTSVALLAWSSPSYGRGHSGSSSSGSHGISSSVGSHASGGHYSSMAGKSLGSYSAGSHVYGSSALSLSKAGWSRSTGNYARSSKAWSGTSKLAGQYQGSTLQNRTGQSKLYSGQNAYGKQFNHPQYNLNQTKGFANKTGLNKGVNQGFNKGSITTHDGKIHQGTWARNHPKNTGKFNQQTQDKLRNWTGNKSSFAEANRRHHGDHKGDHKGDLAQNGSRHHHDGEHHHHHHDHGWWNDHCGSIILVDWGYWGWWDGWWYPAWGYDDYYSYYAYDGPIYGYGGLPPDEVVANIQTELQRLGYYPYTVDGVLGRLTQDALRRYQSDRGLSVTGAIDQETVGALGLRS